MTKAIVSRKICIYAKQKMLVADGDVAQAEAVLHRIQGATDYDEARSAWQASVVVGKEEQRLYSRLIRTHCQENVDAN